MAWNDDDYTRSRDDLLRRTVRRGEHLVRRRRLARWGAAPAALLLIAVPAALSMAGDNGDRTTVAAVGPASTATTAGTTTAPATTTIPEPTTTISVARATTTAAPRTSTTTTTAEPSTTSTTLAFCDNDKLALSAAKTDKPSYRPGEPVVVTATVTNTSSRTCAYGPSSLGLHVRDAAGKDLPTATVMIDYLAMPTLGAGEVRQEREQWDQWGIGDTARALPGTYSVALVMNSIETAPATFQLLPA